MCLTSNISPLFLPNKRIIFLTLKTSGTDFKTELLRYSVGYLYPFFWMIVEKNWQTLFKEKIISGFDSIHIRMIFSITKSGSTGCDAHKLSSPSSSTMSSFLLSVDGISITIPADSSPDNSGCMSCLFDETVGFVGGMVSKCHACTDLLVI